MLTRGNEKNYFTKHCIPNGQDVKPYYVISFIAEIACCIIIYALSLMLRINSSLVYIHSSSFDLNMIVFPMAIIVAEIICLMVINRSVYAVKRSTVITFATDNQGSTSEMTPFFHAQNEQVAKQETITIQGEIESETAEGNDNSGAPNELSDTSTLPEEKTTTQI